MSSNEKNLFIAIPYTGSTTIRNIFKINEKTKLKKKGRQPKRIFKWVHEPALVYYRHPKFQKYFKKNRNTFSIVRNWYSRLFSFYTKYLVNYIKNNINNIKPTNKKWELKNKYILDGNFTFKKFITDFLPNSIDENNILYDSFLLLYLDYWLVDNNKKIIVKNIYKLEEIDLWYTKLLKNHFNVFSTDKIIHKNKRKSEIDLDVINFIKKNFLNTNLEDYGIIYDNNYKLKKYSEMYDTEMKNIVYNIYEKDLNYFNYKLN